MSAPRLKRPAMPHRDPQERRRDFTEVARGLDEQQAVAEAERCRSCTNSPCRSGCPVDIDIKSFIEAMRARDFYEALRIIKEKNNLPAVCGRVCPQESQCEKMCILGGRGQPIAIGALERFAADWVMQRDSQRAKGHSAPARKGLAKAAVIGSGPAGLTCAAELASQGIAVTVFESFHAAGGVLQYGIPSFRLPRDIIEAEVGFIKDLGVEFRLNVVVGKTKTLDQLKAEGFAAFFIGTGAGLPRLMGVPGENMNGVYTANEFLTRINLMRAHEFPAYDTPVTRAREVCVVGGGNVALDSARVALRLGAADVRVVYRRSEQEMPARREEVLNARDEGIQFEWLTVPVRVHADADGNATGLECVRTRLGDPDESGRRSFHRIPNSEFTIPSSLIIVAIGQQPNPLLLRALPGLEITRHGTVVVDADGMTTVPGVFAGGDVVTGAATVIEAMGAGKQAARTMIAYLERLAAGDKR